MLDVGAGDAWVASQFAAHAGPGSKVTCWDAEYTDSIMQDILKTSPANLELTQKRPQDRFGLITLLDVLEHVDDDHGFLQTIVSDNLTDHGFALISVPAWQSLFSGHDVRLRHHRRYSPEMGKSLVERAGLTVISSGGLFHSLLIPRTLQVILEKLRGRSDAGAPSPKKPLGG